MVQREMHYNQSRKEFLLPGTNDANDKTTGVGGEGAGVKAHPQNF